MTAKILKDVMDRATKSCMLTPEEINRGSCFLWASVVFNLVHGSKIAGENVEGRGHTWIEYEGHCYDAETPEGVLFWGNLPFFKRVARE